MNLKNQIVNYFVVPPYSIGKMPRVFISPVTMNAEVGKTIIMEQLKKNKDFIPSKKILHVCFDLDSKQIYIPNAAEFQKDEMDMLLKAAQIKIAKDYGNYSNSRPIEGSPFSSIRVRSVSSFGYTLNAIKDSFKNKEFTDLPVIEANLTRMPTTLRQLPSNYSRNDKFAGGYISDNFAKSITFYDEKEISGKNRKEKIQLLTQKTPFILINISPIAEVSSTEKEWTVLSGYREFLHDQPKNESAEKFDSFADLYAVKRFLYLGWPFEEICQTLLQDAKNFGELINGINALVSAADTFESEKYSNPSSNHYYLTFKIDTNTFPLKLDSMISEQGRFNPNRQIDNFRIIDFDPQSKFILIETPAFVSPTICQKILKSINKPLVTRYNPTINTIDVKSPEGTLKEYQFEKKQIAKISALINHDIRKNKTEEEKANIKYPAFRDDARSRNVSLSNPEICQIRKLSEYYYATDQIKKFCEKNGVEFKDVEVVIGPIERIFGKGVQGGFMGAKQWSQNKLKIPHELEKGLFVTPPLISINSVNMPSYAAQTTTLIHEYCHNIYSITHPEHEHLYNKDPHLREKDALKWWELYFDDPDERRAHIEEIKYELTSGKSADELIRDKVGGAINISNYKQSYPIALKFRELIQEAIKELEQENEKNEKPIGADTKPGRNNTPVI